MKKTAEQHINVAPVMGIIGKDAVLRDEAVEKALGAIGEQLGEFETVTVDGGKSSGSDGGMDAGHEPATILDELRTPSLFGAARVVKVVEAEVWISDFRKPLERYCESPESRNVLLLLCGSLPSNQRIYKLIDKLGGIVRCPELKSADLIRWVPHRAATRYGKKIASAAVRLLLERVGQEPALIDAELSKLATYVGASDEIGAAAIDDVCVAMKEQTVFAVTDAMAHGDVRRALEAWDETVSGGRGTAERGLGGMAWTIRSMLGALTGGQGQRRGWVDQRMIERARHVGRESLLAQQRDLAALDLAVKTGLTNPQQGIELFIVKHTQVPAGHHT
ncbi:MAG: DNA polymerase III subunit delta [Phycisphaerae bacterium]